MFTIYDKEKQKYPIKVWLENREQIEKSCLQQAINLSNLPFIHRWVALMPDTHSGYGMPIGGVIATEGVVIPNAVGVDIGCGMAFAETNIHKSELQGPKLNFLIGQIMRNIPTGFDHHKQKQPCRVLDEFIDRCRYESQPRELVNEIERGYYQIGTLGGGNHFIEIQEDEQGMVNIMLHSGSRNFGLKIAKYFNNLASQLNDRWFRQVQLSFLSADSKEGKSYIQWMNLALNFARENRQKMLNVVKDELTKLFPHVKFTGEVNAHHNYASFERHYGRDVWVHRKGAIRVREGELGIIPGAMGSYSYIVKGKGNKESFYSCSHGAGRKMSRKKARENYSVQETINDLKKQGVVLGKNKKSDVSDECRWAYKDIDFVIGQELDLIEPVKKLKTMAVIKG
ncbi:tRNA-splicing ligase RtcB [Desulfohalotomaculum tongense]|uniref:RtcB family protein n=1 Tax=Desulforadius tongensis TaxID=1216062 RepID=UPI00195E41F0|nr:RtcB family protein [Desulforadius tongensis]MBM7855998.1 tRNA-splicing ligase RtcB [Desulforadius tongensis]